MFIKLKYQSHTQRFSLFKNCSFNIPVKFFFKERSAVRGAEVSILWDSGVLVLITLLIKTLQKGSTFRSFREVSSLTQESPLWAPLIARCWRVWAGIYSSMLHPPTQSLRLQGLCPHSPRSAPLLWVCRAPLCAHLRFPQSLECAERTLAGCSLSRCLCPASASWMPRSLFLSSGSVSLRQRTCELCCLSPPSPGLNLKNPSCSSPAEVWSSKPGGWLQSPP